MKTKPGVFKEAHIQFVVDRLVNIHIYNSYQWLKNMGI